MSEQLSFDRKKGFIALPVEVLELDLSPGAFRLLAELCRMANEDGFCWPSLAQLGERLGRSRSSVSGYIKDLRDVGLITTQEQQMANGYNYRLKYRVSFWKEWRASISRPTAQKDERSVQPTERILKDKNQNHKNHSPANAADGQLDRLLRNWAQCVKGATYPNFGSPPPEETVRKTVDVIARKAEAGAVISTDILKSLQLMWGKLNVKCPPEALSHQAAHIAESCPSSSEFAAMLQGINAAWAHHWRKPPTPEQFEKLVKQTRVSTHSQKLALLKTYARRWDIARNALQTSRLSDCLSSTKTGALVGAFT